MHIAGGQAIINGCGSGLVELAVDPPLRTGRGMSTLFARQRVGSIVLSMTDPEAFITAVRRRGVNGGRTGH